LEARQVDLLPSLDLPLQALAGSSFNPHRRGAVREHVYDEVKLVKSAAGGRRRDSRCTLDWHRADDDGVAMKMPGPNNVKESRRRAML
jgi:hypothetical protein